MVPHYDEIFMDLFINSYNLCFGFIWAWKLDESVHIQLYINGLGQDCINSSALAMELLQSCTKPLI